MSNMHETMQQLIVNLATIISGSDALHLEVATGSEPIAGIAFLTCKKAAFFLGGVGGSGVLIQRTGAQKWGLPVAVSLSGIGIGFQFGGRSESIALLLTKKQIQEFSSTKSFLLSHSNAAIVFGKTGNVTRMVPLSIKGAFIGASLDHTKVSLDPSSTETFYRDSKLVQDMLVPPSLESVSNNASRTAVQQLHHALLHSENHLVRQPHQYKFLSRFHNSEKKLVKV
eukprot:CAMPEP_0203796378 /NCGR_PEP_ID=MMETSP0100_2-20121128/7885_1 /ASSEMBLY_ACC=CAM_ASM_000210 /TAXON_ID=96639 /ORGANISM=" , Strain NY0313808BC1" /LENGTH=225 /DNA_ID=CAMNT_0050701257 /DNA_START=107 /DNA_END=784 /DNA_ORIENTATION=-